MKKTNKNFLLSAVFLSLFGLEAPVFAGYCPDTANPLVISADCYALALLNNKSAVTVQSGVTITDKSTGFYNPVEVRSVIDNFTNNGSIKSSQLTPGAVEVSALNIFSNGSIGTLNNNGTITAAPTGTAGLDVYGNISTLNNNGIISATWNAFALRVNGASINTLNNSGTITGVKESLFLNGGGSNIGTLNNSGTITGGNFSTNNYYADALLVGSGARIGTINNTGTINYSPLFTSPVDGHKEYFSGINNQGRL